MNLAEEYLMGLFKKYEKLGLEEELEEYEISEGCDNKDIERLLKKFPETPESLLELLREVDGTYFRKYGKNTLLFYLLGSDISEYPYYLLSIDRILKSNVADLHSLRNFKKLSVDKRISTRGKFNWLHFADCMNNGGTSQLFIDFSPSRKGKKGQIVRYLHDSDEYKVIADDFSDYLNQIMEKDYDFINSDVF